MAANAPLIDVHTHVVPAGLPFGHDGRFATFSPEGDTAEVLVDGKVFRVITREAWDVEARLAAMDATGRDHAGDLADARAVQLLGRARPRPVVRRRAQRGDRRDGRRGPRPPRRAGHRAAPGPRRRDRRGRAGPRARVGRHRDRLQRARRVHRARPSSSRSSRPSPTPASACSCTRSIRRTGTAAPIRRWPRR